MRIVDVLCSITYIHFCLPLILSLTKLFPSILLLLFRAYIDRSSHIANTSACLALRHTASCTAIPIGNPLLEEAMSLEVLAHSSSDTDVLLINQMLPRETAAKVCGGVVDLLRGPHTAGSDLKLLLILWPALRLALAFYRPADVALNCFLGDFGRGVMSCVLSSVFDELVELNCGIIFYNP